MPLSLSPESNDISWRRVTVSERAKTSGADLANSRPCGRKGHQNMTGIVKLREAHRAGSFRGAETHTRSVLKAVSWRTLGTIDTFAISWFMTGRVEIAGSIAALEVITKIAWYYLHERVWAAISWGRRVERAKPG